MMSTTEVIIEYDDQPDWVAEKFTSALRRLGIQVEEVMMDLDATRVTYRITKDSV